MYYRNAISLLIFAACLQTGKAIAATDTFRIHTDLPALNGDKKMVLDVFYATDSSFTGPLDVRFYKYNSLDDSILVLSKRQYKFTFKTGVNKTRLDFSRPDSNTSYAPKFYEILKRTNNVPPGSYKIFFSVKNKNRAFHSLYLREIDSLLGPTSPVRSDINKSLSSKKRSFLRSRFESSKDRLKSTGGGTALSNAKGKVDKTARKRGLRSVHSQENDKSYTDLFYQDWFAGRYEAKNNQSLSSQVSGQENKASMPDMNALTTNDMDHPSLFSQYKTIGKDKKDQGAIKGEIGITTNGSTGQEEYSKVDNNYYELRGRIELPIMGLPVELEGYYTSQDAARQVKSSYFRVHYNVAEVKDGLRKSLSSYNGKFAETQSRGTGMNQVYGSAVRTLEGQRSRLQNELASKTSGKNLNGGAGNDQMSAEERARIEKKQRELAELDRKIEKYKVLLAQNKNTNYFDSSVGYAKTKDINSYENLSYKQMAKKGSELLPDGHAKGVLAGITGFDAGMFPKNESKYTMGGQMMKGLDLGYDLGFCEAGVTVGKTEYIGRDGGMDKYTCYSGRVSFKPEKAQKISLLYYGYTPDRKMYLGDDFFKNANVSAPTFFNPVHIFSTAYEGSASKYVTIEAEAATSVKNAEKTTVATQQKEKMAYHFSADGNIPNTSISLQATWDKTGKAFENSTLPFSLSGTEQYKLSGRTDLLRSFVTLGVDFYRLTQTNFASTGSNTKWGFDVKTNFKRYPNVMASYKPFTTFHSFNDTLNIPQRPLVGSVWTGKVTYQVRRHEKSLRLSFLYNKSMTTMDTSRYGSGLMQVSGIYSNKALTSMVTVGAMELTGTNLSSVPTTPGNTKFLSLSAKYALNKSLSVSGGQDFGLAAFGFCRYSATGGFQCRFKRRPVTLGMNMRFNTYAPGEGIMWKKLYSGNLDLMYQFKTKAGSKNNF